MGFFVGSLVYLATISSLQARRIIDSICIRISERFLFSPLSLQYFYANVVFTPVCGAIINNLIASVYLLIKRDLFDHYNGSAYIKRVAQTEALYFLSPLLIKLNN